MAFEIIDLNEIESPKYKASKESLPTKALRTGLGGVARLGEAIVGAPRALLEAGQSLGNLASKSPTILAASGHRPQTQEQNESPFGQSVPFLPSAQGTRENVTEPISGLITGNKDVLNPQSSGEQLGQELIADTIPFLFGGGSASLAKKAARGLGISAGGKLAKYTAKQFGFGPAGQEIASVGSMLGLSLLGKPGAQSYAANLYDEGLKEIPVEAPTSARAINNKIALTKNEYLNRGARDTDAKQYVKKFIEDLQEKISPTSNSIKVRDLVQFKKDYNSEWNKVPKAARGPISKIFKSFNEAAKEANKDVYAGYEKSLRADQVWSSLKADSVISDFIGKNRTIQKYIGKGSSPAAKGAGAGAAAGAAVLSLINHPAASVKGAVVLGAISNTADFIRNISKYPELQTYYSKLLQSLVKEDVPATIRYATKLGESLERKKPSETNGGYQIVSI